MNRYALQFALPSFLGVLIFLTPIPWDGHLTIGIGIITSWIKGQMGDYGLGIVVTLITTAALLTLLGTVFKIRRIEDDAMLKELFDVPVIWVLLRLAGATLGLIYFFQLGPDLLKSESIGGAVFVGIAVTVLAIYVSACLFLPLLTDFGFMEFVGILAKPMFRKVFQLPGRSAIDAVASFVGASAIGLLITIRQYERGSYSARHASIIATNFSVVSIPFSLAVATVAGIGHLFIAWYVVVIFACLLCAFITPRIAPLSRKPDSYFVELPNDEHRRSGKPLLQEAWHEAKQRAQLAPGIGDYAKIAVRNLMFFIFSVMPAAMALATFAALLTFHTPIFSWLGYPFAMLLDLLQFAEATSTTPGFFAGFMDQYMPAITASGITSEATSFVLAGLSVCQLIYMSEVGVIILRSSLPISFAELVMIFLLRTAIVLPVLIAGAVIVVG